MTISIGFIVASAIFFLVVGLLVFWLGSKVGRDQARGDWIMTGVVTVSASDEPSIDEFRYAINVASEMLRRRTKAGDHMEQLDVVPGTWWKHRFNGTERLVKVTAVAKAYAGHRVTFRVWNHDLFSIDADVAPETEVLSTFVRRAEKTVSPHEAHRQEAMRNSLAAAALADSLPIASNLHRFPDLHQQVNKPTFTKE